MPIPASTSQSHRPQDFFCGGSTWLSRQAGWLAGWQGWDLGSGCGFLRMCDTFKGTLRQRFKIGKKRWSLSLARQCGKSSA